ncbi:hypothetical protein Tco_0938846 [Tanacetum coccineum]|uniref:Tf2-1-like SH3-like domain-containing protein n=1 Tax=Tanacetum coccineum TaxID=301880 RepID=A0ABQ5DID0_9ASTR
MMTSRPSDTYCPGPVWGCGHYACYYYVSSQAFLRLVNLFTSLTERKKISRVEKKYEWGAEQKEAFQTLKNDLCKANVVTDALSRKERVKLRRVRAMAMTIQYGVRGMILTAQKIRESSLIGPELVQETTDEVVLIKEKLKAARDRQKSYADNRRKPLEFEVGDRVMLKVSLWKGVICFGKKGKLALRYVGSFEILERIGPVAYRLRLLEELSGVHDTFHVSNLKKCLADASLHVTLDEIKVDKTLRFVEEPEEIMDREVKSLNRSRILLVKVH